MAVALYPGQASALNQTIARATRRVRARRALQSGSVGLLAGCVVVTLPLLAARLNLLDPDLFPADALFFVPPFAGAVAGALWGLSRPVAPLAVARLAEARLDLKDRLSTAYTLVGESPPPETFAARQIADAEECAAGTTRDLSRVVPLFPLPRLFWAALAAGAFAVLLWFLPAIPFLQTAQQKTERAAVQKEGERLVRIGKALEKEAGAKKLPTAQRAAARLTALGQELKKGRLSQQKAMMKVATLTEQMKQAQQAAAASAAQKGAQEKSLASAGKELQKAISAAQNTPPGDGNKNNLNAPANGAGDKSKPAANTPQEAMKQAGKALSNNDAPSLAEQLSKMADHASKGEPGQGAERDKLAQQVGSLGKALDGTSLSKAAPALKSASDAMKKGDMATASQKMREAAKQIADAEKQKADANAMQQAADAMKQGEQGNPSDQSQEGATPGGSEGQGEGDAFGKDGGKKGKGKGQGHKDDSLKPGQGDGSMGGDGKGEGAVNSIGSGEGKLGGPKPKTVKGGKYLDANYGPKENKDLNRQKREDKARDDKGSRLYAPDGKENNTRITGKKGDKGKETVSYFKGAPDKANSSVPYYEVYSKYAPAAENAMSREDIPASYKKQVKTYFDSLKPKPKDK